MSNEIVIKATKEEKDIVKEAAGILGLGHSTFARASALKEAKRILNEFGQSKEVNSENE